MSDSNSEEDISMPSKVIANSIFVTAEIMSRPQIWNSIFIPQDWDLVM